MNPILMTATTALTLLAAQPAPAPTADATPPAPTLEPPAISLPGSPFGISLAFLYGYDRYHAPAYRFGDQLRRLHAGLTKVYLMWNQLEPQPGRYDFSALDAFAGQLRQPEQGLVALFSASEWATRTAATQTPGSPPKNMDQYYQLVYRMVRHARGRVRYWQNDAEANSPVYWAGSKQEFVAQLKVFYRAVKDADPQALVVVGGHDGNFNPPGSRPWPGQEVGLDFFEHVFAEGRDAFDVFDLRLYGIVDTIVGRVQYMRERMRAHGYEKPIVALEYGGPMPFELPQNHRYISLFATAMQAFASGPGTTREAGQAKAAGALRQLYQQMPGLPPQTQMFLFDCPPALEARYRRIQARQLVMRNLLALSAGVQKLVYFQLPQPRAKVEDRYDVFNFMFGKFGLVDYAEGRFGRWQIGAQAFARMARALEGVRRVRRIEVAGSPEIFHFEVDRGARGPLQVIWHRRDLFAGEDAPPVTYQTDWPGRTPRAIDVFGRPVHVQVTGGRLRLSVTDSPVYIEHSSPRGVAMDGAVGW